MSSDHPFQEQINSLINDSHAAHRTGRRLRRIREEQNLTQTELGEKTGLTRNRIQQYENGARKPKTELTKQFASVLGVEALAIQDPVVIDDIGAMYGFFEMENAFDLKLKEVNNKIYLCFGSDDMEMSSNNLNEFLKAWFYRQVQRDSALDKATSEEEKKKIRHDYNLWKWNFPASLIEDTPIEIKKVRIRDKIAELQEELSRLENEK